MRWISCPIGIGKCIVNWINALGLDFRTARSWDVQGFDYQEACQVIGKPIGTLKSRLARARLAVQDCLQGAWELLPESYRQKGDSSHA